ncbi:unnamed protein product [Musa banksii]
MVVQASNHIKTAAHARGGVPKCPCDNVSRWAMEPADKITGISIGAASCVNSIKITFDIDGTTRVTPRYGGPGGELFQACLSDLHPSMHLFFCLPLPPINTCYQIYKSLNFTLMQDEYLTSVSGYVKHDCSKFPCVSQLTFTTNLGKKYGPYGGGGGTFFEVNVEYDEIKGFFGHATEEYLTAFGVYPLHPLLREANPKSNFDNLTKTIKRKDKSDKKHGMKRGANHYYKRTIRNALGRCSQHHVDSKYSEMLGSCISKEAFDVVIFYVYFEKGSTPTSIWTMCPSKIGAKHELRYARKVRKMCLTYPETEVRYSSCMRMVNTLHMGCLSQHHVDSKCSEILCSCLSKETLNLVIFYVDFKKVPPHLHMDRMSFQDWW